MAEKRMFAKSIVTSDKFLDLPLSAQALYFQLAMRADDDGFVGNPNATRRSLGATAADITALAEAGYLIEFPSGVVAIRHWFVNNYIAPARHRPTIYTEEQSSLSLADGVYNACRTNVEQMSTQYSIDKNREEEDRKAQSSQKKPAYAEREYEGDFNDFESVFEPFERETDSFSNSCIDIILPDSDSFDAQYNRPASANAESYVNHYSSKTPANAVNAESYVNLHSSKAPANTANAESYVNHNYHPQTTLNPNSDEEFLYFWNAYPRKRNKIEAFRSFLRVPPADRALLLPALEAQKRSPQWNREGGRYIPYPATWLNNRRWEDEAADSSGIETNNPFLKLILSEDFPAAQDPSE